MIIVEPPASRYETSESAAPSDEHLLERVSALENRVARLSERLERGLDLLLRQAQSSYFDRALVKALVALLSEDGIVEGSRLEQLWNDHCQKDAREQEESTRREAVRVKILAQYRGRDRIGFDKLVTEGFLFIEDGQQPRGIRTLQRAVNESADNAPLLAFIGEHFFKAGKSRLAQRYLERAHEAAPGDIRISLLLGLTCADEGDIERAKHLLNSANRQGGSSFAAHYSLGRMFVAEENWQKALREFKRALASKPSPEAHYALGCLYYQLCKDSLAARHLRKAVEMDSGYSEAHYLLGLTYQRSGQENLAEEAFARVGNADTKPGGRRKPTPEPPGIAPLFQPGTTRPKGLITGADRRLAEVLRQDALRAFSAAE